jgi:hypothetical protein
MGHGSNNCSQPYNADLRAKLSAEWKSRRYPQQAATKESALILQSKEPMVLSLDHKRIRVDDLLKNDFSGARVVKTTICTKSNDPKPRPSSRKKIIKTVVKKILW